MHAFTMQTVGATVAPGVGFEPTTDGDISRSRTLKGLISYLWLPLYTMYFAGYKNLWKLVLDKLRSVKKKVIENKHQLFYFSFTVEASEV
jgi:hypothetical protein